DLRIEPSRIGAIILIGRRRIVAIRVQPITAIGIGRIIGGIDIAACKPPAITNIGHSVRIGIGRLRVAVPGGAGIAALALPVPALCPASTSPSARRYIAIAAAVSWTSLI